MWKTLTYPWEAIGINSRLDSVPEPADMRHWCSQIVTLVETIITSATTGSTYPTQSLSEKYKVLELPGPAIKGDMSREIILDINRKQQVTFHYFQDNEKYNHSERRDQFELFFDRTMNAVLFLIRECLHVESHKTDNMYWDKILDMVHANEDEDPAKYALVVDLARLPELIEPIDRITGKPKRVLRRIHDQVRIQKVQEIDTKCLLDLARRPGTVLSEKAGSKQRILAIQRTENINILENRVTKHCCSLAALASKRYLREHQHVKKSKRKESVQKLYRDSKRLPRKSSFNEVTNLVEPCRQPNYTLMQNPDYYKIWKAYVQLVRNEDLRYELWKWNRRMWSDYMGLFLADLLHSYQIEMTDKHIFSIGQKTVFGKRKQDAGKWLISDTMPGPFIVDCDSNTPGTLYVIHGDHDTLKNLFEPLYELAILNADYLALRIQGDQKVVFPIYAILPSHHLSHNAHTQFITNLLPSLIRNLRLFKEFSTDWSCKNGWVLLGNWTNRPYLDKVQNLGEGITGWATAIDPNYKSWSNLVDSCDEQLMTICGV